MANFFNFHGQKLREERQTQAPDIATKLMEKTGYDAATIGRVVKNYVDTGNLEFPNALPQDMQGPPAAGQMRESDTNRFRKRFALINPDDKSLTDAPAGITGRDQLYESRDIRVSRDGGGGAYVWNPDTEQYEVMSGASSRDKFVRPPAKPAAPRLAGARGGGGGQTADERAALQTHQKYLDAYKAVQEGKAASIPDDVLREMESAAPVLGMTMEDVEVEAPKESLLKRGARAIVGEKVLPKSQGSSYKRPVFDTGAPAAGGGQPKPIRAKNPKTGERIVSYDGGKTWQAQK